MHRVNLVFSLVVSLLMTGCFAITGVPSGTRANDEVICPRPEGSSEAFPQIIERVLDQTAFLLMPIEGGHTHTRSRTWTYWFAKGNTRTKEIQFLRRERLGWGIKVLRVDAKEQWIALDIVSNVGGSLGVAQILLFSDEGLQDQTDIHFDNGNNGRNTPLNFSDANRAFTYQEDGMLRVLVVRENKLVRKVPNQSLPWLIER